MRFFILGTTAIFVLEACIAFYLNNFYIKDTGDYSVVKVPSTVVKHAPLRKISIGSRATRLSASHDGSYLAYLQGGLLVLADFATGQKINVPHVSSMKISDYKWIYDRDRLIITEIKTGGYPYYGKMYYIDMKDRKLVEIRDNYYNRDVKIALYGSGDTVSDLDMSAETNLTFLKVTYGSGKSKLWESNIMVSTNPLNKAVTKSIGRIACLKMSETLFYENLYNGMVYRYGSNTPIKIGGNTQFKLMGVDQNDNIYLAKMNGRMTGCVYYGNPLKRIWKSEIGRAHV